MWPSTGRRQSNLEDLVELAGGILLIGAAVHAQERVDLARGSPSLWCDGSRMGAG